MSSLAEYEKRAQEARDLANWHGRLGSDVATDYLGIQNALESSRQAVLALASDISSLLDLLREMEPRRFLEAAQVRVAELETEKAEIERYLGLDLPIIQRLRDVVQPPSTPRIIAALVSSVEESEAKVAAVYEAAEIAKTAFALIQQDCEEGKRGRAQHRARVEFERLADALAAAEPVIGGES